MLREIMGEMVAIPVGGTVLEFNGMICLNPVGEVIFRGLQQEQTKETILQSILERFEVSREEATGDLEEFLLRLRRDGFLEN